MSFFRKLWRKVVFFTGDVRRLSSFPYVTWDVKKHKVNYDEIMEALSLIKYGDIGLHRDIGYLSNIAIPGFMKHAWIHVEDGLEKPGIVEAVSEGVIDRSPFYPLFSDYAMILSPENVSDNERKGACKKANGIVGEKYDVDFKFDIEVELKYYAGEDRKGAEKDLRQGQKYMRKYSYAFSCTEAASYSWWHKREQLRLYRKRIRSKEVIVADDFINKSWKIKWLSQSVTLEAAKRLGLHEEGLSMINKYLAEKRKRASRTV